MSKARITLLPEGRIEVRLALDLLITAGSRDQYYQISQSEHPLTDPEILTLLAPLAGAIELSLADLRLPLALQAVAFPQENLETFRDPLQWPRTSLLLTARLPPGAMTVRDPVLRVRYTAAFRFEEPIANTFEYRPADQSQTRWLVTEQRSPAFDASAWLGVAAPLADHGTDWAGLRDFLRAGFLHIVPAGADHLLFVAALCLGAASARGLLLTITLFTVAHSITLAAMTLGWLSLAPAIVEPVIVLSIFWAALVNLFRRGPAGLSLVLVLGFGLVHGLGFAGALRELGLPAEQQLPSLLAFNLGVEAGQISFILALLVLLMAARWSADRRPSLQLPLPVSETLRRTGSGFVAGAALLLLAV